MADSSSEPWSDNPNAPQIPHPLYTAEKTNFGGFVISAMLYGIVIVLFFQCMAALLSPVNTARGGAKWGLVAHTVAMFSFLTINTALSLHLESISYIDNRAFPGSSQLYPGPYEYQFLIYSEAIYIVPGFMFQLNQWLADGLLLYRCHIIYGMNYWVTAFPCLAYLASVATGIVLTYLQFRPESYFQYLVLISNFQISYTWISLGLNIILTAMIIVRLILHSRNLRNALGAQAPKGGPYKSLITMLIESFALYSVCLLLFTALNTTGNPYYLIFNQVTPMAQVIAPFLIIVRVAKQRAVTGRDIKSADLSSINFGSQGEPTDDDSTPPDGDTVDSTETSREIPGEPGVQDENVIEEVSRSKE